MNYFTAERGIERAVLEISELVNETADHIAASRQEVLQMKNIYIQSMTSTKRGDSLKEYLGFVEQDHLVRCISYY